MENNFIGFLHHFYVSGTILPATVVLEWNCTNLLNNMNQVNIVFRGAQLFENILKLKYNIKIDSAKITENCVMCVKTPWFCIPCLFLRDKTNISKTFTKCLEKSFPIVWWCGQPFWEALNSGFWRVWYLNVWLLIVLYYGGSPLMWLVLGRCF